jgi:PAS domain S-box-containing protein
MLTSKLPYKFLVMFLVFSCVLIVAFSLLVYHDSGKMIKDIEAIGTLTPEQKAVYTRYMKDITESLVSLAFYVFVLAFILSLFFSRKFLVPVRELYRGAKALKDGNLDIKLDVITNDELGEVTKAFNDMAEALRKKTDELMRKELYVSAMLDPLWIADMDNIIIDINPAFTRLFGYERDEVIGSSIFDFLDEESEKIMRRQFHERDKGIASTYQISIISKTEGLIPVLISGAPLIENGEVIGKIGIIKDFRHELALRDALKEERDYTEAIMDSMVDALLVIDREYRIVKANMAARVSAGQNITGKHCHSVFHASGEWCFLRGMECPVKIVFDTGKPYKTIHEHSDATGSSIFHEIIAYPVKDRYGEVKHAVEIMRDITERKRFEDEIELKNRELTTLNSISKILSRSLKAEDIFNNVLDRIVDLLGMDGGGIFFLDEMNRVLKCKYHRGMSEDFIKSTGRIKVGDDIPGRVALTGQSIITPDISKDTRSERSVLRHSGIKGYACIPIRGKEKLLGVFFIFSFNPYVFTPEEERILNSISEMMGIAFENIRLYEKMRELYEQQRLRRASEQKNLLDLSSMLASTLDIKSVLASSLSLIKDSCKADLAWMLETDDKGDLILKTASGNEIEEGTVIYPDGTSCIEKYAMERKTPVVVSEIASEPKFYVSERVKSFNTAISIPLYIGKKTLGAFTLYYRMFKEPKEEMIHFLQTVGSILAVSIERSRLYERAIIEKGMADTILESIADGVMTVDIEGKVISMNRAAEEMIGLSPRGAVGMQACDVFRYNEGNTELRWRMGECLEAAMQGNLKTVEAYLYNHEGKVIPLMLKSAPVRDQKGEIVGVVYVLRDISREREIDRMKTEFVKAVSHEFRTPLSAIVGMTEMVLDGEVTGIRSKDYLSMILSEGRRLSDMVSDLLDIARIESGRELFREKEIDFESALKDVERAFKSQIEKKEIKFSSRIEGDVKGYKGDEEKLKQLLRNLVENSVTYSDRGCAVEVVVRRHGNSIQIVVRDEGWGIAEEDLKHIGEKFYRGRHAARTKGTGLGLSLCKDIAKMHGGTLHVTSKRGEGTTVVVELPIREGE